MRGPAELAYEWRDALVGRDADRFALMFSEDGVMIDLEHRTADRAKPRPLRGRDDIRETTRAWCESVGDFRYVVDDVVADGDRGAVCWTYEWKATAGQQVLDGVTLLYCRDGCITRAMVYFDSYAMLSAEGLGGQPALGG